MKYFKLKMVGTMKWYGWLGLGFLTAVMLYAMRSAAAYSWEQTDVRQMGILHMFMLWCWILVYSAWKQGGSK